MAKWKLVLVVVTLILSYCPEYSKAALLELELGREHRTFRTGINGIHTDSEVELWFGYGCPSEKVVSLKAFSFGDIAYLLSWTLPSSKVGETFSVSADTDLDFDIMASILTNGVNNPLGFQIYEDGAYSGLYYWESSFPKTLKEPVVTRDDFAGYTITRIDAKLNSFTFKHYQAANFTERLLDVEISIYGTPIPEPATLVLLGLGGALMLIRRRRG